MIDVKMRVMGVKHSYRFKVSEPNRAWVLVESGENAGVTTTSPLNLLMEISIPV